MFVPEHLNGEEKERRTKMIKIDLNKKRSSRWEAKESISQTDHRPKRASTRGDRLVMQQAGKRKMQNDKHTLIWSWNCKRPLLCPSLSSLAQTGAHIRSGRTESVIIITIKMHIFLVRRPGFGGWCVCYFWSLGSATRESEPAREPPRERESEDMLR